MRWKSVTSALAFTELFSSTMVMAECVQVFFFSVLNTRDLDTLKLSMAS